MGVSLRCASGRRAAGYAIASVLRLRYALLTHPSHASRKLFLDVLPCFYTYSCFTLLDIDYQIFTRLKFFYFVLIRLILSSFALIFRYVQG
ncbi:MAG: hypothetical protein RML94_02740 [Bacteroidia bacterium]|nr:hypothetical protein [Bacteroidia bacterium]